MPKHGAATQFEDADVETWSCHTVQNCNAETQKETANDAETQAVTFSGQDRHSQSATHMAETTRELR